MHDIKYIIKNSEKFKELLNRRNEDFSDRVDELVEIDIKRREFETLKQQLLSKRKSLSKSIGELIQSGKSPDKVKEEVNKISSDIEKNTLESSNYSEKLNDILLHLPNTPNENTPIGKGSEDNVTIREWGKKIECSFQIKNHIDLAENLNLVDFSAAAKISGSGFAVFTGEGARLQRAIIQFMLDVQTEEHGFTEVSPPVLVKRESMQGTGQLPKFEFDSYGLDEGKNFLVPTAEVPVTNLFRDMILKYDDLPKKYTAYTPCFRREAGSTGRDTRGLMRMHQFDKVELVKISNPENSYADLEHLTLNAEAILQKLNLHYRVIELCTGDLGFSASKTYDLEVWAPGQNEYLEVSSCSNFEDFQARRMNLRFKDQDGTNRNAHTLNGSGLALPRLYIAILENYQNEDGSITIPEVLRDYVKKDIIKLS